MSAKQLDDMSARLRRVEALLALLLETEGIGPLTIEKALAQLEIDAKSAEYANSVKRLRDAMEHREWMGKS